MTWCKNCLDDTETDRNPEGYVCCTGCGRIIDQDFYTDEPIFVKDSSGQSRLAGSLMKSWENAYSSSRENTLQKGRDEIENIMTYLEIGDENNATNSAHRLYQIAVDKNFTKGRPRTHVAAACLYIHCRIKKLPYLLIDFADHLMTSVYVLGAVFLQLCQMLRLTDHPIVQNIVDPSLFIHRFTERLFGSKNRAVADTALRIVASMKRDWMQTGRKPSGLCGAAIYISALSHGFNFSKPDVVKVVHVCEATLTKRLIEFENTKSGGLTIEEFLTIDDELSKKSEVEFPKPGEVLCKHKEEQHFAHGLCRTCFDEFYEVSGGLEGDAQPPAFQRAEKQRMEREKTQQMEGKSSIDDMEVGVSTIDSDLTISELMASKQHKPSDSSACSGPEELDNSADKDPESLSDIDDVEVDGYLHDEEEKRLKKIIWEEMNKEYLEEQAMKEAAEKEARESNPSKTGDGVVKPKRKRQRTAEDAKSSAPADSPLEATRQMLKKKTFSSRVNYEALEGLYTTNQAQVGKPADKLAINKESSILENDNASDAGAVDDGDEAGTYEDGDFAEVDFNPDFEYGDNNNRDDEFDLF